MLHASDKSIPVLVAEALTSPDKMVETLCGQRTYTVGLSNEPNCPECIAILTTKSDFKSRSILLGKAIAILNPKLDHITHARDFLRLPFGANLEKDPIKIPTLCGQWVIPSSIDSIFSCPECNEILDDPQDRRATTSSK